MRRFIVIRAQFEAIHHWPECPIKEVEFLRYPHRHVFYVEMKWEVQHNDRDKEFIVQKRKVNHFLMTRYAGQQLGRKSCEDMAEELLEAFPEACYCSVFEDNENGAELQR